MMANIWIEFFYHHLGPLNYFALNSRFPHNIPTAIASLYLVNMGKIQEALQGYLYSRFCPYHAIARKRAPRNSIVSYRPGAYIRNTPPTALETGTVYTRSQASVGILRQRPGAFVVGPPSSTFPPPYFTRTTSTGRWILSRGSRSSRVQRSP